jgi:plastocyanin
MQKQLPILVVGFVVVVAAIIGITAASHKSTAMPTMSMTPAAGSSAAAESTNAVTISNYAFAPANITVKVGTKFTWTNQDAVKHTVTGDNGGPSSDLFGRGQSYSYTFDKAGSFAYHCLPHPYMKGNVTVTN